MSYVGFESLSARLQREGHSKASADAISAAIGRKKYTKKKFDAYARKGKKMRGVKPAR